MAPNAVMKGTVMPLWCFCAPLSQIATSVSFAHPKDRPLTSPAAAESNAMLQRDVFRLTEVACPASIPDTAERVTNWCNEAATDLIDAGQLPSAWRVLLIAIEISSSASRSSELRCLTYSNMAYVLYKQKKFDRALAYAQKAHTVANMSQDNRAIGSALLNVGTCTGMVGEWAASADLCTKAIYRLRANDGCEAACALAMHNMAVSEIHQLQDGDQFDPAAPVETLREASLLAEQHLPEGHLWRRSIDQANKVAISLNLSVSLNHPKKPLRRLRSPGGTFGVSPHRSLAGSARSRKPRRVQTAPRQRPVHAIALPGVSDQQQHVIKSSRSRRQSVATPNPSDRKSHAGDLRAFMSGGTERPAARAASRSAGGLPFTKLGQLDGGLKALVQQRSKAIKSQSGHWAAETPSPQKVQSDDVRQSC